VGGFLFGMLGANVVRRSGLEQQANEAIESELGWVSNPDIVSASDAMDQGRLDEAAAALQEHLTANPPSIDALNLLQLVQRRRQDMPAYLQATSGLGSEYQDGDSGRRGSLQAPGHRHTGGI
jgi:ribosomal protein S15P/S13E